jgi:hypothetical protein
MPSNPFMMWGMVTVMVLIVVTGPLIRGDILGSLRAAYPADPTKREALDRCGAMDADFSRFLQKDRDVCYQAMRHTTGQMQRVSAHD